MKLRLPFLSALCLLVASVDGQSTFERRKMDFQLEYYLQQDHEPGEEVDLFIHGQASAVESAVKANGGHVKMAMARLVSAGIPVANVRTLAASPAVERFEFSLDRPSLLSDSMRVKAHVNEVQAGLAPLPQAYDGQDVVVGIIDSGLDVTHPDFQNEDGTTRVLHYWDQNLAGPGAPPEFGYGQEWSRAEINAGQLGASDYNSHGTTVTGCATGNARANGRHKGVAPAADIIVVTYSGVNFRSKVVDAVKYIFDRAEAAGKPAVVNASVGSYSGSHDGQDAAALLIDSLIAARRGQFFVCAAGNQGSYFPFHFRTQEGPDTSFTWLTTNQNGPQFNVFNYPNMFFEAWTDLATANNLHYAVGADRIFPTLSYSGRTGFHTVAENLGGVITEPLIGPSGNTLGTVQYFAQQRGAQVQMQILIASPDTLDYYWRFMTTGSGHLDAWTLTTVTATSNVIGPDLAAPLGLPFPTVAEYPPMAHCVPPDRNSHIVDSWACSPRTLTVANFNNQVEYQPCSGPYIAAPNIPYAIAGGSSSGPTRDDRYKPDIAAPGDVTMAAGPMFLLDNWVVNNPAQLDEGCMHMRNGGTSMASPVVAGVVALYLQKCPNADWQQIRNAMINTAWGDALTGPLPNLRFGYGRVHAFNALVASNLPDIAITATDDEMCSNATVDVTAAPGFDAYLWSNGSTDNPTAYTGPGPLSVVAATATGCAHSNGLLFTVLPAPPTPVITPNGSLLTSSVGPSYQWYLDGNLIGGATGQQFTASTWGDYTVEHVATNGCVETSAPVFFGFSAVPEANVNSFTAWPSLTEGNLTLRMPPTNGSVVQVQVFDARGALRFDGRMPYATLIDVPVNDLPGGAYSLRVFNGTQQWDTRFVKAP